MTGDTHRSLSEAVALAVLPPDLAPWAREMAAHADDPDEFDDVSVGRFGTTIAGQRLSSLNHFCVPTSGASFRGYCWSMDASLCHAIRYFDPRVGDVACRPAPWIQVVGKVLAPEHPLVKLIASLKGRATLDADNFTFPTAAVMADWAWMPPSPARVGCICHWIQDLCVPHHAHGWLLKGHAKTEQRVAAAWNDHETRSDVLHRGLARVPVADVEGRASPLPQRTLVELLAEEVFAAGRSAGDPGRILARGVAWTALFLRGAVLPLL